jgi:hypothetical protein
VAEHWVDRTLGKFERFGGISVERAIQICEEMYEQNDD